LHPRLGAGVLKGALLLLMLAAVGAVYAPASGPAEGAPSLRVMSFNIRYGTAPDGDNAWEHRRDLLLETITTFDPDILGTQECLQLQAEFLQAGLPGHEFVGVGRDDGRQAGEMCAIFFRSERFEKLGEGHFWLSETPDQIASKSWDAALTRIASWVRLREKASRREFIFMDTHFDHVGEVARRESAALLARKAREIASDLPVILTGDFNADADQMSDGPYRVLLGVGVGVGAVASDGRIRFVDTYRSAHPRREAGEGTFNNYVADMTGPRIDWILTSPGWKTLAADIVRTQRDGRFASDHFAVTAVVVR
jgi:endonuclease/exonuclease/phosphatase family metal-dependent hydrolase